MSAGGYHLRPLWSDQARTRRAGERHHHAGVAHICVRMTVELGDEHPAVVMTKLERHVTTPSRTGYSSW